MAARAPTIAVAAAVAVAFADSSVVVLALPELYVRLHTSILGVSWVITAYNLAVAVGALVLVPLVRCRRPPWLPFAGLGLFLTASVGCGVSTGLAQLVAFRAAQGAGAALLLVASLPLLASLAGSAERGLAIWATAGALGTALGPALGGVLTQAFGWRAIFVAQAPVAAAALLATLDPRARRVAAVGGAGSRRLVRPNVALAFLFAGLVGALFLAVLLVVTVWDYGPLAGAGVVSALPAAALAARPLASRLAPGFDVAGGACVLAAGLACLAFLPAASAAYAASALALCGAGLGLALPPLTRASVGGGELGHAATVSVAARHAGFVLALVLLAPLLGHELARGGERASLNATAAILDAPIGLTKKIPIALDLRDAFESMPDGEIPDLERPFDRHGAGSKAAVREARDSLLATIRAALTRSFRTAFGLSALLALLAAVPALVPGRRAPA